MSDIIIEDIITINYGGRAEMPVATMSGGVIQDLQRAGIISAPVVGQYVSAPAVVKRLDHGVVAAAFVASGGGRSTAAESRDMVRAMVRAAAVRAAAVRASAVVSTIDLRPTITIPADENDDDDDDDEYATETLRSYFDVAPSVVLAVSDDDDGMFSTNVRACVLAVKQAIFDASDANAAALSLQQRRAAAEQRAEERIRADRARASMLCSNVDAEFS